MIENSCNGMRYVIRQGDTLYKISRLYRVPLAMLLRANPYMDVYNLQIGDEICIPVPYQPMPRNNRMEKNLPETGWNVGGLMGGDDLEQARRNAMMGENNNISMNPEQMGMETERSYRESDLEMDRNMDIEDEGGRSEEKMENESMMTYIVQSGDTMESILDRFALEIEDLLRYNALSSLVLCPGSRLLLPEHMDETVRE